MSEQDALTERELAEMFQSGALTEEPRSVGEALAAADEPTEPPSELGEEADEPTPVGPPVVVEDQPTQPEPPEEDSGAPSGTPEAAEPPEEEEEDAEVDQHVVWAKAKYGDEPAKWAKAAYDSERHISRLANEKKEAEELATQWYEYSQSVEADAASRQQMAMPLSSGEEQWVENSLANPMQYAMQAASQNNFPLYQAVIARVAEENPMLAANIGAQVQRAMEQQQMVEANGQQQPTLADVMGYSIQRLGIDLATYGDPMSSKIAELGEHHPYVQTILEGDQNAREIALMAVYDLVRSTAMSTRKVRSEERENQIKHEAELRRQAAGVVTGGPHAQQPPAQSGMLAAMEQEWKDRGQWSED